MPDGGVGNSTFPDDRPGHRVQRDDRGVDGPDEDLVAVQGDAAIHLVAVLAGIRRQLPDVTPQQVAGRRLQRQHLKAAGIERNGDEHVPVVDDGRRLVVPVRAGGEGPHRLEGGDVRPRDAIERAVSPAVVGAAIHRPVVRLGAHKPLGGHRGVAGIGRECCRVPRGRTVNGDSHEEGWQDQPQGWNQAGPRPCRHRPQEHQRCRRSRGWFLLQAAAIESMVLVSRIRNRHMGGSHTAVRMSLPVCLALAGPRVYRAIRRFARMIEDDGPSRGWSRGMPLTMRGSRVRGGLNSPRCTTVSVSIRFDAEKPSFHRRNGTARGPCTTTRPVSQFPTQTSEAGLPLGAKWNQPFQEVGSGVDNIRTRLVSGPDVLPSS